MEINASPTIDQNDRIMAALSHISILIPGMGFLVPVIIWVTQREKSRWVSFQALQAVTFQLSLLIIWILGFGCYFISFLAIIPLSSMNGSASGGTEYLFLLPFAFFGLLILFALLFIVIGVIAAIQSLRGENFHYPLIGAWLERTLKA